MKSKEARTKSVDVLRELLKEKREKLRDLRFALSGGKVKNVREIMATKRDIAKILTIIRAKQQELKNKKI